jgi:NIPSNAP
MKSSWHKLLGLIVRTFGLGIVALTAADALAAEAAPVYELRIYTTHPGKMPDMLARFRDHTCKLFERHGMINVGYWLPTDPKEAHKLYYVLQHQSRAAAQASWKAFMADPAWHAVRQSSEAAGAIVAGVESVYLERTDYSPGIPADFTGSHIFELRTYVANEGKLAALDTRFREHTVALFAKHGMINLPYWHPTDADKGGGKTLIYLLAHTNEEAAKKSWESFRADPEWITVRTASEANGSLLVSRPQGIYLRAVDFSALK